MTPIKLGAAFGLAMAGFALSSATLSAQEQQQRAVGAAGFEAPPPPPPHTPARAPAPPPAPAPIPVVHPQAPPPPSPHHSVFGTYPTGYNQAAYPTSYTAAGYPCYGYPPQCPQPPAPAPVTAPAAVPVPIPIPVGHPYGPTPVHPHGPPGPPHGPPLVQAHGAAPLMHPHRSFSANVDDGPPPPPPHTPVRAPAPPPPVPAPAVAPAPAPAPVVVPIPVVHPHGPPSPPRYPQRVMGGWQAAAGSSLNQEVGTPYFAATNRWTTPYAYSPGGYYVWVAAPTASPGAYAYVTPGAGAIPVTVPAQAAAVTPPAGPAAAQTMTPDPTPVAALDQSSSMATTTPETGAPEPVICLVTPTNDTVLAQYNLPAGTPIAVIANTAPACAAINGTVSAPQTASSN